MSTQKSMKINQNTANSNSIYCSFYYQEPTDQDSLSFLVNFVKNAFGRECPIGSDARSDKAALQTKKRNLNKFQGKKF
jgi:hypothetical protein